MSCINKVLSEVRSVTELVTVQSAMLGALIAVAEHRHDVEALGLAVKYGREALEKVRKVSKAQLTVA